MKIEYNKKILHIAIQQIGFGPSFIFQVKLFAGILLNPVVKSVTFDPSMVFLTILVNSAFGADTYAILMKPMKLSNTVIQI